jgi:hypothetical protein
MQSVGASRALIQETIQAEVLRRNAGRLSLRDGCRAAGLLWNADKTEVEGLELRSGELLAADLVVVAGGRHALLPQARAAHMRTGLCSFPLPPLAHARMRHYRPPSCPHIALASSRDACSQPSQCRHYAQWLAAAGHPVPPTLKVDAQLAYVGRMYKIPAGWDGQQVGRGCQH